MRWLCNKNPSSWGKVGVGWCPLVRYSYGAEYMHFFVFLIKLYAMLFYALWRKECIVMCYRAATVQRWVERVVGRFHQSRIRCSASEQPSSFFSICSSLPTRWKLHLAHQRTHGDDHTRWVCYEYRNHSLPYITGLVREWYMYFSSSYLPFVVILYRLAWIIVQISVDFRFLLSRSDITKANIND